MVTPVEPIDVLNRCANRLGEQVHDKDFLAEHDSAYDTWERKHILVVDDNSVVLRNVKSILQDKFSVAVAMSAEQAMQSIAKAKPDLILLDYDMPEINGAQMLQVLRSQIDFKDIPVVFLTGVSDAKNVQKILKLHPDGYLLKPPVPKKILEIADHFVNGRPLSDE